MAEVTSDSAEGMDVKIELARIEMKGKEAAVTFMVSTDSGPGPHFEIDFLVLAHNGLDDALAASQMALRLFVAGLAGAGEKTNFVKSTQPEQRGGGLTEQSSGRVASVAPGLLRRRCGRCGGSCCGSAAE